ncbi:hypothetical protein BKA70DRAFT_1421056 [Coprinopsis sp. MPI-PUGE-AT-0042]|nr:hypothetical protein BKA70DRAFT_1421056 [Coprinopsis sp. MPI-PUGE-AT-0042]
MDQNRADNPLKDGVDTLESLRDAVDDIVSQDAVEWSSSERLITLMIVIEQYRRSHVEFVNDHFPLLQLEEEETDKEIELSRRQQQDLRRILRGDPTMRSFFVEAVLIIASWHVFLTWMDPDATMRHFWVVFNDYFRPSDTQTVYASEYYQNLTQEEMKDHLQPALKRTIATVRESFNIAIKMLRDSDQTTYEGVQDVFASDAFKTDYIPEFKADLKADSLPDNIQIYVDTVCSNAAIVKEVIESWDSQ